MSTRFARFATLAESCNPEKAAEVRRVLAGAEEPVIALAQVIASAYPALEALSIARVDALSAIARDGFKSPRKRAEFVRRLLAACGGGAGKKLELAAVRRGLRRASSAERLRIALRELMPEVEVDVTAREWSDLAEAQLEVALMEARAHVEERFGPIVTATGERNGFVVIGLGKLGGSELNAGSDIDLMFLHESDEGFVSLDRESDPDALRPFDAFTRIARRLVPTLEEHDDDGFCARVDLRLRPEGGSGPLTNSIASAVGYYENFGRGWERAALLRARAIAGDLAVGVRALSELTPFVYRRAVDPNVALEMHEMARRARVELSEAPLRDLKLGPGGIREAEFFVQSLQLIWGGKDATVRSTNTFDGLRRLRTRGYVTDREARAVADGYLLLRRVEHRVQLASGVQTHVVPPDGAERDRLARSLGYRHGADLWAALERVRGRISELFASLAPGRLVTAVEERIDAVVRALDAVSSNETADSTMRPELLSSLRALARRPDAPLGGRTRERHPRFSRALIGAILDAADPELASGLVRTFFDRLSAPSVATYVRMLGNDERALARFVGLCGTSAYLGGSLVGHPELVDRLLFSTAPVTDHTRGARLLAEEIAHLDHADRQDAEGFVGAMRRAKAALELEVGLADLGGEIGTREASRALSTMAQATVEAATNWALEELSRRRGLKTTLRGLAVLGMGKLGGREIGYGSDLDVVFVYDPIALDEVSIDRLDAGEIYGRVAARIVRLIGTPHPEGPGYELDTRLRPSGEQGHLVVSIDAFRAYHLGEGDGKGPRAQDWERQALLRLRACGGDALLGERAEATATIAAYERGAIDAAELLRLRERLEVEVARERPGRHDVKLGRGGLADVEFAVQYLQMQLGHDESVRTPETLVALDALESRGALRPPQAGTLRDGYRFLRRLEQRARVVHGARSALLEESAPGLTPLSRSMGYRDGPIGSASEQLIAAYREITSEVRAAFLEAVRAP